MQSPPIPEFEELRLQKLNEQQILDTQPEEGFDSLTELAAELFDVPVCLFSLIDRDRQWFKSRVGFEIDETPRELSFCAYSVASREPLIVEDTFDDERFADHPVVAGDPQIRFYAGAPVYADDPSLPLGNLCIVDMAPRRFTDRDRYLLELLARQVDAQLALRMANRKARAAIETKRRLLANVSHELRTPIHGIVGMHQLLALTPLDPEQAEYLDVIEASAQRLDGLVDSLLKAALLDSGRVELYERDFDLGDLVVDLIRMVGPVAQRKGVEFDLRWDPDLDTARYGDPDRLRDLLLKVVQNALAFTQSGSVTIAVAPAATVDPEAEHAEHEVRVDISDTGSGIPADQIERMYEPFTQLDDSPTRTHSGLGLGLTLARRLAEVLGGTITATSEVGEGSVFTVIIPLRLGRHPIPEI